MVIELEELNQIEIEDYWIDIVFFDRMFDLDINEGILVENRIEDIDGVRW